MQGDLRDLYRLREQMNAARAEALRLGQPTVASVMTEGMNAIDRKIAEFDEGYDRTWPQIEALKRMVGAT